MFAQSGEAEYLVLSAWRTTMDHQCYLDEHFGQLRERAKSTVDLDGLASALIDVEPSWALAFTDQLTLRRTEHDRR